MTGRNYNDIIERNISLKNKVVHGLELQIQQKRGCYYSASISEMHRLRELHLYLGNASHIGEAGKQAEGYLTELSGMLDKLAVRTSNMRGVKEATKDTLEQLAADAREWADIMHRLVSDTDYAEKVYRHHQSTRSACSFKSNCMDGQNWSRGIKRGSYGIGCTKLG